VLIHVCVRLQVVFLPERVAAPLSSMASGGDSKTSAQFQSSAQELALAIVDRSDSDTDEEFVTPRGRE
jgi:hypothetical protein